MFDQDQLRQLKNQLTTASSVLTLLPPEPEPDSLAAALSLHLSCQQANKSSFIGCSSDIKVSASHLFGVDQIKKNIGRQNLVISFDYQEGAVEHVSYDISEDEGHFNLRIRPKTGSPPLDTSTINYSYTGANADIVFTLGINSLEELGSLYSDEKQFLDEATIINLTLTAKPTNFAALNLNTTQASSLSEVTAFLLKQTGLNPTADAATNLYQQIITTTSHFQSPKITPTTFELAAFLLRSGAQKVSPLTPKVPAPQPISAPQSLPDEKAKTGVPSDWQGPKIYRGASGLK